MGGTIDTPINYLQVQSNSAQPCGCDIGIGWMCAWHQQEQVDKDKERAIVVEKLQKFLDQKKEVLVKDPVSGGLKGSKLARFSLIPRDWLWALAEHYGVGARKYDDRNWEKGYKWSLSLDAHERHLSQWLDGENDDAETGSHHLIAAAWHLVALWWFQRHNKGTDDIRPVSVNKPGTGLILNAIKVDGTVDHEKVRQHQQKEAR